jgi:hypothetical protein
MEKEVIEVLDFGIDMDDPGPLGCCWGAFAPVRG